MALLEVNNLGISFGGLRAVNEFHVSIKKGETVWSDRPQRSRKNNRIQSADRSIQTGQWKHSPGWRGPYRKKDLLRSRKAGIARTFQNIRLFSNDVS